VGVSGDVGQQLAHYGAGVLAQFGGDSQIDRAGELEVVAEAASVTSCSRISSSRCCRLVSSRVGWFGWKILVRMRRMVASSRST
jgi:hypothetical protein